MPRTFEHERLAVWCLIGATAVLCVVGAMAQFLDLPPKADLAVEWILVLAFAALCGFSLWVANVAAACAQTLAEHRSKKPWAFAIALITAGITGLVSVIGVDLSYLYLVGEQQAYPPTQYVVAAGFALGFVKVAMGFVIAACELVANAEERDHDALLETRGRRIQELEREVSDLQARLAEKPFAANDESPVQTVRTSRSRRAPSAAARRMASELRRQRLAGASGHEARAPSETVERVSRPVSLDELKQAVSDLIGQRKTPSIRLVAENLNVKKTRVEKALTANQTTIAALAA